MKYISTHFSKPPEIRHFFCNYRMYSKMDQIDRHVREGRRRGGGSAGDQALTALAQESFDILTLLPTYIESTKSAVTELKQETHVRNFYVRLPTFLPPFRTRK